MIKSRTVGNMKVEVDRELCIGAASCVTIAPNTFVLDDEGKVSLLEGQWDDPDTIQMAADSCPVRAITLTYLDSQSNQLSDTQAGPTEGHTSDSSPSQGDDIRTQAVFDQLKTVLDPELGVNVVDLGLVYGVDWQNDDLIVTMTLTTPGCPLINEFLNSARHALQSLANVGNVSVNVTFEPLWTPSKMSQDAKDQLGLLL